MTPRHSPRQPLPKHKRSKKKRASASASASASVSVHGKLREILAKQISTAGKPVYRVLWEDGAETEIRPKALLLSYPTRLEAFEQRLLKTRRGSKGAETIQHRREDHGTGHSETPVEAQETRLALHYTNSNYSSKDHWLTLAPFPNKSRSNLAHRLWQSYSRNNFIRQHWMTCSKCDQKGSTGFTCRTMKRKRHQEQCSNQDTDLRLFLCTLCSSATHIDCLPEQDHLLRQHFSVRSVHGSKEFKECLFYCCLCLSEQAMGMKLVAPQCSACHRTSTSDIHWRHTNERKYFDMLQTYSEKANKERLYLSQHDKNLTFRCSQCKTNYHYGCLPGFPDALDRFHELPGEEVVEELCVAEWRCAYCITYDKKIETVMTWRRRKRREKHVLVVGEVHCEQWKEVLVKWKDLSYRHASWVPGHWLARTHASLYRKVCDGTVPMPLSVEALVFKEWAMVDRILAIEMSAHVNPESKLAVDFKKIYVKFRGLSHEKACWDTPPSKRSGLYPAYVQALARWKTANNISPPIYLEKRIISLKAIQNIRAIPTQTLKEQPASAQGSKLLKYQLDDFNWLFEQWVLNKPMVYMANNTLERSIQSVVFLYHLFKTFDVYPFIVTVESGRVDSWMHMLETWAPDLYAVAYHGSQENCRIAAEYEIFRSKSGSTLPRHIKCHVVLFTFESFLEDPADVLSSNGFWPVCMFAGSSQRIHDFDAIYERFNKLHCNQYISLIGEPTQNRLIKYL